MFTIVTFVGFTALVALISWMKTRGDDLSTKDGYFLAGRGLPGIVIAGSLMMTNLSAEQLVGTNGQSFAGNMSPMAFEVTSSFALIILAFLFLPKFLKGGITTIPEFFEMRFDTTTKRLFSLMFLIAYIFTMLPVVLYSGAVVLEKIFDISGMFGLSYFWAIALVCAATGIIGAIYAIFGGLKAVAVSDTINGVGLLLGGFMVPVLGILALGALDGGGFLEGIKHFISATPEKLNAWSPATALPPEVPWPVLFTGMIVNNLFYWATNQSIIQRSLAGKNLAESQKGAIWAGFFKILDAAILVIPGIIAYQLLAGRMSTEVGMAADSAYPMLILEVVPKPLLGFLAAVMFGAILSSFNSVLNSSVTIFTLDLYQPIFAPQANAKKAGQGRQDLRHGHCGRVDHRRAVRHVLRYRHHELYQRVLGLLLHAAADRRTFRSVQQARAVHRAQDHYSNPHRAVRHVEIKPVLPAVPLSVCCIRAVRAGMHHLRPVHQVRAASRRV